MPISILIGDDHAILRQGVVIMLEDLLSNSKFYHASSYMEVDECLFKNKIDLLICDVNMPGFSGFSQITQIKNQYPQLKILVFSAYSEDLYALRYLQAGANGYLNKNCEEDELQKAVTDILNYGKYVSNATKELLIQQLTQQHKSNIFETLSNREMEVAKLLSQGMGILEISHVLKLQTTTISTYKTRLFEKLNITSIPQLVILFQQHQNSDINLL